MRLSRRHPPDHRRCIRRKRARVAVRLADTDDQAIGGDIDLLVETAIRPDLRQTLRAQVRLERQLGEPVDLLTGTPQSRRPIERIARLTGIPLT